MNHNIYIYIFVMAAVTYLIRMLPLTLIRKEIKSTYIKSFLYYVPYVTLAAMTFPAILSATANIWSCRIYHCCIPGLQGKESAEGIFVRMSRRLYC